MIDIIYGNCCNPHRVIVLNPSNLKNKQVDSLAKRMYECFRSWDKMRIFGYPYGYPIDLSDLRQEKMSEALRESQVHTIILHSSFTRIPRHILSLGEIHSLEVLRFQRPFIDPRFCDSLVSQIDSEPRLKKLAEYTKLWQVL
ncbi:hypothetical protein FB45DRAFT_1018557 [Roridomyces roridus]|uniref:Uncharacterized protein n=1 Tax=Roridomyces roridus TaxID=1738132 RepID=A0AAD7CKP0_9AGAR|nr:hypothetical protein FB45DRAFT_1018557 [Roridomyces roridus]